MKEVHHYGIKTKMRFPRTGHPKCWKGHCKYNVDTLLLRMSNGTITLENSSAISYKTKYTLMIQSSNHAP